MKKDPKSPILKFFHPFQGSLREFLCLEGSSPHQETITSSIIIKYFLEALIKITIAHQYPDWRIIQIKTKSYFKPNKSHFKIFNLFSLKIREIFIVTLNYSLSLLLLNYLSTLLTDSTPHTVGKRRIIIFLLW